MNEDWYIAKYLRREELIQQAKKEQGWYFVTFERELPRDHPYGFTLFGEPFVLFKDKNDKLICYLLPSSEEENSDISVLLFKVMKKQDEIWLWRGEI